MKVLGEESILNHLLYRKNLLTLHWPLWSCKTGHCLNDHRKEDAFSRLNWCSVSHRHHYIHLPAKSDQCTKSLNVTLHTSVAFFPPKYYIFWFFFLLCFPSPNHYVTKVYICRKSESRLQLYFRLYISLLVPSRH